MEWMTKKERFNRYLVIVGIRIKEFAVYEVDVLHNLDYFKRCFNSGLSAYKALLFFNDYMNGDYEI